MLEAVDVGIFFENIDIGISTAFFKLTSVLGEILPIGKPLAHIANEMQTS